MSYQLKRGASKKQCPISISFAAAFVAATALRVGAVLLHKDPQFKPLASQITQEMLPPKTDATATS